MKTLYLKWLVICLLFVITPVMADELDDIPEQTVAFLHNVLVSEDGDNFDFSTSPEVDFQNIEVIRDERTVRSRQGLPLLPNDIIAVKDKTIAQLCYSKDCNPLALIPPNTRVSLKSREALEIISDTSALGVFIRKHGVKFQVHLPYVIAGSEGTEFYSDAKQDKATFAVLDGEVTLKPGKAAEHNWQPVKVSSSQSTVTKQQKTKPTVDELDYQYQGWVNHLVSNAAIPPTFTEKSIGVCFCLRHNLLRILVKNCEWHQRPKDAEAHLFCMNAEGENNAPKNLKNWQQLLTNHAECKPCDEVQAPRLNSDPIR